MRTYSFFVPAFSIPFSEHYLSDTLRLNQFQSELYNHLNGGNEGEDILLVAPTGGGKTLTLLLNTKYGSKEFRGFVALYPNNTLLENQMCTVEDIIVEHMGASLIDTAGFCENNPCYAGKTVRRCECMQTRGEECVEPLTIYRVENSGDAWVGYKHVGFLILSGKHIISEDGVPKREVVYKLAEKALKYTREGGLYLIVFATPDTYLLLFTGAYRDFDGVGKTVHNMLTALAEGKNPCALENVLRRTGVLSRDTVGESLTAVLRLDLPLFVDEFHLYGPYELDALYGLLRLYKETIGHPVIFSSATPAEDSLKELDVKLKLKTIEAEIVENGEGFPVRGDTMFEVIPVHVRRKGLPAYFMATEKVPEIVVPNLLEEFMNLRDGRALIILDRLWMVSELAKNLTNRGIEVECIATITPPGICKPGAKVIIGSEATTQGINLGRVVLGVTGGTSSEDVIQRIGRVGRKGVSSKVYLIMPDYPLNGKVPPTRMNYYKLVRWINSVYPDYPKRKKDVSRLIPNRYHEVRRKLIYSVGVASLARLSGMINLFDKINLSMEEATEILESIVGSPSSLTKLLMFRRTGFNVRYLVEGQREVRESSIGLIARNFKIKGVISGILRVDLSRGREVLTVKSSADPSPFAGKIVGLRMLLSAINGYVEVGDSWQLEREHTGDNLVYVLDCGDELSEYLSYTGEGAKVLTSSGERYAIVFV